MLSYRHAFHAGNHADLLKHSVLCNILESLCKKDKPFTVIDTHAGAGLYNLEDERAVKTGENQKGIISLLNNTFSGTDSSIPVIQIPESLDSYLKICSTYAAANCYPGSPELCRIFMNEKCHHLVFELHNSEINVLQENTSKPALVNNNPWSKTSVKTQCIHSDGLEGLKALSSAQFKRGLILIDPSYEEKAEYEKVLEAVKKARQKWSSAIIAVWIPLLNNKNNEIENLTQGLIQTAKLRDSNTEVLVADLCVYDRDSHKETSLENLSGPPRLYGSRMVVLNMCWNLDLQAKQNIEFLLSRIECETPLYSVKVY